VLTCYTTEWSDPGEQSIALGTLDPISRLSPDDLPCRVQDPDLWFAETPAELEQAKKYCAQCPVRVACLRGAIERREPWGVWGGQISNEARSSRASVPGDVRARPIGRLPHER